MTPEFERAVGGMADIPQWFVWRLEWDAEQGKYLKRPARLDGTTLGKDEPKQLTDYDTVRDAVVRLKQGLNGVLQYAMGFWLTEDCGYWFLDLDKCADGEGGLVPFAAQLVAAYPGAMVEWSSSRNGVHVIGMGDVPALHRTRPERALAKQLLPMQLEFYTRDRGIAFGLDGVAQGCADSTFAMRPLVEAYFPERAERESTGEARPEWRGPADDDVLIERMLAARVSAEAAFGGKASVAQLWAGDCEHNSEADMALASHLAFWTGCDEPRIERIMLRSGLKRDKWFDRRPGGTYLTFTIGRACESCDNVYQEPQRNLAVQHELYGPPVATVVNAPVERVSAEVFARVEALLDEVSGCGDELTLHNVVIPNIQQAGVPMALQERLVTAVQGKLKFWDNKMAVGRIRALLFPPAARAAGAGDGSELPEWAKPFCFVVNGDRFFNTNNSQYYTVNGFHLTFGRHMPVSDTGRRENASEKCLHFWGMPIVEQVGYRPDQGAFYDWQGVRYANEYSPTSLPPVASAYTEAGIKGIEAFQAMLYDMCGRRDEVFRQVLYWMAHNVQRPGVKIRWSPIIKGVHGDGKTLAAIVLRAAMGYRNVSTTSNSNISNSGGFTDWAVRGAVNIIEEIMLTGKVRHQLYNAMKEFITNDIVDINPKGATPYQAYNITNHIALTNHNDALPMEKTDRRWMVVFTPWSSLAGMMAYCGLDAAGWKARTDSIDYAKTHCASELRAWFLSVEIPVSFDINGSALVTPEKQRMMASSSDNAESIAASLIANGGLGISEDVISSSHLSRALALRAQTDSFDVPKGIALNHMFTRMGYSKVEKQIKWNGQTHTVWLRDGVELGNDQIRDRLELTAQIGTQTQTQT